MTYSLAGASCPEEAPDAQTPFTDDPIILIACGNAVTGTYQVVSVNGDELPATFEWFGTATLLSGSLTLENDMAWSATLVSHDANGVEKTEYDSGTFTVDDANFIHFTPGADSEDQDNFEATWDGEDQVTVMLHEDIRFIFRR